MRKKRFTINFRPTEKNRIYLSKLGMLDAKTGKKRDCSVQNISEFVNDAITDICEADMVKYRSQATEEELRNAWVRHCLKKRNTTITRLHEECQFIAKQRIQVEVKE